MTGPVVPSLAGTAGREPGPLAGKRFVITGTLSSMSRDAAIEAIESHGGKVTGSVSKNTSFVVFGGDPGSKLARAEALGIPVLDEAAFRRLIGL
jgi:DNA ligase (NAD+)